MKKNYKTVGIVVVIVLISIFLIFSYARGGREELIKNNSEDIFLEEEQEGTESNKKEIVVEIKGEIKNPDVYWVKEESIIEDLILIAGGLTEEADVNSINRAEMLKNHQSIVIPNKNEQKTVGKISNSGKNNLVNINTASVNELDSLPGIGASRAEDIVKYREDNNGFKSIEEIKNITGIGESIYEKLKDKITI